MMARRELIRILVLGAALAAAACSRKESQPSNGAAPAEATSAGPASAVVLWEPVDKSFTGCEGA